MALRKRPPLTVIAVSAVLVALPTIGVPGGTQVSTMKIAVNVGPSSSFKVQNGADLTPTGFTAMSAAAPVLVINTPAVKPEVIVEVSADVAGPASSKVTGELGGESGVQDGGAGGKQLSLRDLGVASPPPSRRGEGSDLKQAFERAAGEIVYRLDLLNKIDVGRQSPVIVSINL